MVGTSGRENDKYFRFYKRLEFLDNISFCVENQNRKLGTTLFKSKETMILEITTN
jgi:hypothetical protein